MVSFLLSGIACAFVALCYAELASLIPVSGSTYTYTYATLGEIFAWIIGWDLVLEYAPAPRRSPSAGPAISTRFCKASRQPPARTHACSLRRDRARRRDGASRVFQSARRWRHPDADGAAGARTQESAAFNNVIVVIKVAVVLAVIIFGAPYVELSNWTPLTPENSGEAHFSAGRGRD